MKWVEIKQLRIVGKRSLEFFKDLLSQVVQNDQRTRAPRINIYRHQSIESDLLVVLKCESDNTLNTPCDLGLHLAAELREFGRVDHAVWLEM